MDKVKNTVLKRNIASNMETAVAIKIAGNVVDYDNSSCGLRSICSEWKNNGFSCRIRQVC